LFEIHLLIFAAISYRLNLENSEPTTAKCLENIFALKLCRVKRRRRIPAATWNIPV